MEVILLYYIIKRIPTSPVIVTRIKVETPGIFAMRGG